MKNHRFTSTRAAWLAIASLTLAALACAAQAKSAAPQPQKSSDPAILWQFDTHG